MSDEQIWQTAIYYALSTIAQMLAAAFGILATFMLFRFEHAEGKIKTHGDDLSETVSTLDASVAPDDLVARLKEGNTGAVEEAVERVIEEVAATTSEGGKGRQPSRRPAAHADVHRLRAAGEGISFWSAFHKMAMRRLRQALLLTVTTIALCLVQLPLVPLLTRRMPLAATLTAVAVLLALVCLAMYARLILLLLAPEAEAKEWNPAGR